MEENERKLKYKAASYIQFFSDGMNILCKLPDDQAGTMIKSIFSYFRERVRLADGWDDLTPSEQEKALNEAKTRSVPLDTNSVFNAMFIGLCENTVDRSFNSYNDERQRNSYAGKRSAEARREANKKKTVQSDHGKSSSCRPAKPQETKKKYGEYGNVLLTDTEYQSLVSEFGKARLDEKIVNMDAYIQMHGTKYKDHRATLRAWLRRDNERSGANAHADSKKRSYDAPEGF